MHISDTLISFSLSVGQTASRSSEKPFIAIVQWMSFFRLWVYSLKSLLNICPLVIVLFINEDILYQIKQQR